MLKFERIKSELVAELKVVSLYKDYLINPDGKEVVYDLIRHKTGGGAAVLLVDENECTYLVEQYRNSINRVNLEIPAGGYSSNEETGETCAKREAEEETGYIPKKMIHVSKIVSAIGTFDETTDIYIGLDLQKGTVKLDPDEFVNIVHMPIKEVYEKIISGEIVDGKTVTAIFAYLAMKEHI